METECSTTGRLYMPTASGKSTVTLLHQRNATTAGNGPTVTVPIQLTVVPMLMLIQLTVVTVVEQMLRLLATVVLMLMLTVAMLNAVPPSNLIRIQLTVVSMELLLTVPPVTVAAVAVTVSTVTVIMLTVGRVTYLRQA
jgi:hypothetical protein